MLLFSYRIFPQAKSELRFPKDIPQRHGRIAAAKRDDWMHITSGICTTHFISTYMKYYVLKSGILCKM